VLKVNKMKIKTFYNIILKLIRTYEAVVKAHTGAVEAHHGAMEVYPGGVEANPGASGPVNVGLTPAPWSNL
jgi:hypothetical protein